MLRIALRVVFVLWLALALGCQKKPGVNGTGWGGTDGVRSATTSARSRVMSSLSRLQTGEKSESLCRADFCGDSSVACEHLRRLAQSPSELDRVRARVSDPIFIGGMQNAAQEATYRFLTPEERPTEAVNAYEAWTQGKEISFFIETLVDRKPDVYAFVWFHELGHVRGLRNSTAEELIADENAACLLAYTNGLDVPEPPGASPTPTPIPTPTPTDDGAPVEIAFNDGGTALARHFDLKGPFAIESAKLVTPTDLYASPKVIKRTNVRATADLDFTQAENSAFTIFLRQSDYSNAYYLGIGRWPNNFTVRLMRVVNGQNTRDLGVVHLPSISANWVGQLVVEMQGSRFRVSYGGTLLFDADEAGFADPKPTGQGVSFSLGRNAKLQSLSIFTLP